MMLTSPLRHLYRPLCTRHFHSSSLQSSGHNKWSKIKQRKGANDIQKGALYSRTFKEIVLAVRNGGGVDPEQNNSLAAALKRAKEQGVPKDNIKSALEKAAGAKEKAGTHLLFEAMGPGSTGIIVECLSDNSNRTIKFLSTILKDNGGRLADVKFLFKREGRVKVVLDAGDDTAARLESLVEVAMDAEAEDFEEEDMPDGRRAIEFRCPPTSLHTLTSAVAAPGCELLSSELVYAPIELLRDLDDETGESLAKLVQAIEEAEDTLKVWTTADSSDL